MGEKVEEERAVPRVSGRAVEVSCPKCGTVVSVSGQGVERLMALRDLLEQNGIDAGDRAGVFNLLLRLPLAPRARVALWEDYLRGRGEDVTAEDRAALSR